MVQKETPFYPTCKQSKPPGYCIAELALTKVIAFCSLSLAKVSIQLNKLRVQQTQFVFVHLSVRTLPTIATVSTQGPDGNVEQMCPTG